MDAEATALSDAETLRELAILSLTLADSDAEVDAAALADADTLNESATL